LTRSAVIAPRDIRKPAVRNVQSVDRLVTKGGRMHE
jgi:hypothetical protein